MLLFYLSLWHKCYLYFSIHVMLNTHTVHSSRPCTPIQPLCSLCCTTGILKFNEVYLGEPGFEMQDGSGSPPGGGGGAGVIPLSLDQLICNAREALGVDSHYSR